MCGDGRVIHSVNTPIYPVGVVCMNQLRRTTMLLRQVKLNTDSLPIRLTTSFLKGGLQASRVLLTAVDVMMI